MVGLVVGRETAAGVDDSPPGERAPRTGEQSANGSRCAGVTGFESDFAVGHDRAVRNGHDYSLDRIGEMVRRAVGQR